MAIKMRRQVAVMVDHFFRPCWTVCGLTLCVIAIALLCVAWYMRKSQQYAVIGELRRAGGFVSVKPVEPAWLRRIIGENEFAGSVDGVDLQGAEGGDRQFQCLESLSALTFLSLYGTRITDAELSGISRLTRLEFLALSETQVSDIGPGSGDTPQNGCGRNR